MFEEIKVIAFDADDTLWVNETYFREAEDAFTALLSPYETKNKITQELFKTEIKNLSIYGYGVKGFVLSMLECALVLSNYQLPPETLGKIIAIGKEMLEKPIQILDGVEEVLESLQGKYKLIVATKGDLLDQERKLEKSNLLHYFHHIEVMSDKKEKDYLKLVKHLDIVPGQLLMIGNSLKSDVLPLLEIGAKAIHIPFHTTWIHEEVSLAEAQQLDFKTLRNIKELIALF
ncbi:MAG: HAD family hydrolase [Polaribacter sp.]|uniref:HAD family hydrolase n=1 Tax=Polaribacter sp. TaxID=1920175 RepID=UPI0038505A6E